MIKAMIYNNEILHTGNFGINVVISQSIINLVPNDFVFVAVSGNGTRDIIFPDDLEISYRKSPAQTLCLLPIELPEDVGGSFRVSMRDRLYTVDNAKLGLSDVAVGISDTEEHRIICDAKVFRYNTT